jgi:hypothetical protein
MNIAIRQSGWNGFRVTALTLSLACAPLLQGAARATTLDAGTVLPVRLNIPLSSKDAQPGDTFTATLRSDSDAVSDGVPAGTRVQGVVRMARPQHDRVPGMLDLDFRRVVLPNGESFPIYGSLIGLDNKSVRRVGDGRLVAVPNHTNDQLTYLGYGAGAGFIIGALTHRPVTDTLLGGSLGLLFGSIERASNRPRDVNLKAGTELGVRLDQRLMLGAVGGGPNAAPQYHITEGDTHAAVDHDKPATNQDANIGVLIGDRNVNFSATAQPMNSHGVVLVPVRPVLDALGIAYHYDRDTKTVRASGDRGTVRLALDSSVAIMDDGRRVRLDAPAQRLNDVIYVPIRFFELAGGRTASYDSGSHTVLIDKPIATSDTQNGERL